MTKERNVNLQVKCLMCNTVYTLKVAEEDAYEYYASPNRRYIQDIFHYLTPAERELLISGTCDTCWNKMFSDDDEESLTDEEFEEKYGLDNEEFFKAEGNISVEELKS